MNQRTSSKMARAATVTLAAAALAACDAADTTEAVETTADTVIEAPTVATLSSADLLSAALDAQSEEMKARYAARNPADTLAFFGIEPGMTVVEALPGGGWYTKILIPYLGSEGKVVGVDYAIDMWPKFGFMSEEQLEAKKTWTTTWVADAKTWGEGADIGAFVFGAADTSIAGSADAVLMIRALHNLNRFESDGGFRTEALSDAFAVLKPGGILGVVQHRAPAGSPDDWADGSNGYLKQDALISAIEATGFELVETSEINANELDQPTTDDFVWRLPPTLGTSRDNEELRAEMTAIGESDRMTLKFRKPAESSSD